MMTEATFKRGDRVKIVRTVDDRAFSDAIGQTGVVVDIDGTKIPYCVKCDLSDRMWCEEVAHLDLAAERPIEVGDHVRLDVPGPQFVGSWQEGVAETLHSNGYASVRIVNAGPDMAPEIGNVRRLWLTSLRRIPRPAEAQAMYVRWWPRGKYDASRYSDGSFDGTHLTIEHHGPRWYSVDGFIGSRVNVKIMGGEVAPVARPAAEPAPVAPPAPVLVDGLDFEHDGVKLRDLLRMEEQRHADERSGRLKRFGFAITPAQRAAVSAHWSAALRAKVAASREAERCRVCVDLQDEP